MAKKFKVGDKVRVLNVNFIDSSRVISSSDIFEVKHVTNFGGLRTNRLSDGAYLYFATDELRYVEKVEVKPSKSERISLLESQVAELTAKVEALEKVKKPKYTLTELLSKMPTPNEQRKALIERAKAFVAEGCDRWFAVEFHVNSAKRTVVALLRSKRREVVITKAIAKCAPDDVFNADIGKAIALGRALGLDVSEFENAVKPTEFVKGHTFKTSYDLSDTNIGSVTDVKKADKHGLPIRFYHDIMGGYIPFDKATIIDDTEAQY